jgi:hypothetical protein
MDENPDQLEADIARGEKRNLQTEIAWHLRQLRDGSAAADAEVAGLVQEWLAVPVYDHVAHVRILAKCDQVPAKLRLAAIKANQPISSGISENADEIHRLAFNSIQLDGFARLLAPGERYLPGQSTPRGLRTNVRIYTREEITAACRTAAQLNDAMFAKGFPNEAEVRAAEDRLAEANRPTISPGTRGMANSIDWGRR